MSLRWLLSRPISANGERGLKEYKYRGVDHSLIYKLMLPMLNRLVNYFPMWVAPNLITLSGLLFMAAAYVLLCGVIAPELVTEAPRWVYLFCALAKFMYQILDELDGKQARRTGSSSPLGELFDHGCDALSCVLTTTTIAAAMQLGAGWHYWALNVAVFGTFYSTIWEQLHTNFLELHYLGPNEAHTGYIVLMLATAFAGPSFWAVSVFIPVLNVTMELRHLTVSLLLCGTVIDVAINFIRVQPLIRTPAAFFRAVYLLFPFPLSVALSYAWIRAVPAVLAAHPQALALGLGFMNSHLVGTLILSRVTTDEANPYTPSLFLLALITLLAHRQPPMLPTSVVVLAFALFTALNWAHFALSTIYQLCDILKVRVLRIPVRPTPLTTPAH